jgi:hypothetical protein
MKKIKVNTGRDYFAIVKTLSGTYVCPGWTPVPPGTTRDMIELVEYKHTQSKPRPREVTKEPSGEWQVESSRPGKFYQVTNKSGQWDCTCPAKTFHRGDCKHIKSIKSKKVEKTLA